jgi:Na+/H+ antiporter NhaD/arsenite permease-like protein
MVVTPELIIAVSVFAISLGLLIFDWIDKTIIALSGALILIVTGVLSWEGALKSIDFETLALLLGLMITVIVAQHSGIFSWLSTKIAEKSKGNPLMVFLLFTALTFFASTILNNATVVLLIIPIAIALANGLGLNSKLLVIVLAIFSNIGGTLTLIGDPPNTLIGVKAGLSFNDFLFNLSAPVFGMSIVVIGYLLLTDWNSLKPNNKNLPKVFSTNLTIKRIKYKFANIELDRYTIICTLLVILGTVISFIIQPKLGITVGVLGMISGVLLSLLLFKKISFLETIKEVEWDSLLFFTGLFIQVGALQEVGFLKMIADYIANFGGSYTALLLIILWSIGLASTIINNIPFVALMIPVIFQLQATLAGTPNLDLLWWALALGACLGGNGTVLGSSAGLLAVDVAKKNGLKISFMDFAKVGMPITIITLLVSSIYLVVAVNL